MEERTVARVLRLRALEEAISMSFKSDPEQEEGDHSSLRSPASFSSSFSSPYQHFLTGYVPLPAGAGFSLLADSYAGRQQHADHAAAYGTPRARFDIPIEVYLGRANIASPMMRMGSYMKHCTACGREWQPNLTRKLYAKDLYEADEDKNGASSLLRLPSVDVKLLGLGKSPSYN